MSVQPGKLLREYVVSSQRAEQAAHCRDVSDEARHNEREEGKHENTYTCASHIMICRVECRKCLEPVQIIEILDILIPARVFGRICCC